MLALPEQLDAKLDVHTSDGRIALNGFTDMPIERQGEGRRLQGRARQRRRQPPHPHRRRHDHPEAQLHPRPPGTSRTPHGAQPAPVALQRAPRTVDEGESGP